MRSSSRVWIIVIQTWNRGAEQIYGYTAEEVIGKPVTLLTPPDRRNEPEAIIEKIIRDERVDHLETVRLTKDGSKIDILLIVGRCAIWTDISSGALTIAQDITARKQAEKQLKRLQQNTVERALVMETANRVALDILASRTGTEALRHIAEAARTLSHARYAALGVARPDGQGLMEFVTTGLTPEEEAASAHARKEKAYWVCCSIERNRCV